MKSWIYSVLFILAACVNQTDTSTSSDARTKTASQIQPRPLFVSGKSRAEILKPGPLQTITSTYTFYFSTGGATYGSVLIFNTNVNVTAENFASGSLAGKCVAGASNLAGHAWNNATLRLDSTASGLSEFYTCDASNPNEPLSTGTKFTSNSLSTGATYYWIVLGYDKSKVLTHSSGLEKFIAP